jgi:hypothetical protein
MPSKSIKQFDNILEELYWRKIISKIPFIPTNAAIDRYMMKEWYFSWVSLNFFIPTIQGSRSVKLQVAENIKPSVTLLTI